MEDQEQDAPRVDEDGSPSGAGPRLTRRTVIATGAAMGGGIVWGGAAFGAPASPAKRLAALRRRIAAADLNPKFEARLLTSVKRAQKELGRGHKTLANRELRSLVRLLKSNKGLHGLSHKLANTLVTETEHISAIIQPPAPTAPAQTGPYGPQGPQAPQQGPQQEPQSQSQFPDSGPQAGGSGPQSGATGPQFSGGGPQSGFTGPQSSAGGPQSGTTGPQSGSTAPQAPVYGPQWPMTGPQGSGSTAAPQWSGAGPQGARQWQWPLRAT